MTIIPPPASSYLIPCSREALRVNRQAILRGEMGVDEALAYLFDHQLESGGWTGEKPVASLDDGASQWPICMALARIAEHRAAETEPPVWLTHMALDGVAFLLASQMPCGLFPQIPDFDRLWPRKHERYRSGPTLNDGCSSDAVEAMSLAWVVLGDDAAREAVLCAADTIVRLLDCQGVLHEQYLPEYWRPNNEPPLLSCRAREHEIDAPSTRAMAWGLSILLNAFRVVANKDQEATYWSMAHYIVRWLESRAVRVGGGWIWPRYLEGPDLRTPVYGDVYGRRVYDQSRAHNPNSGWWTDIPHKKILRDARAVLGLADPFAGVSEQPTPDENETTDGN